MYEMIEQIKDLKIGYYNQNFHYSISNWLPFYWKGFRQTTRYTYVIEDISDIENVFKNFDYSKKKNINKARKTVRIKYDLSAQEFYEHHKMTLNKQNQKISYSQNIFYELYRSVYERGCGKTIYAIDDNEIIHAALFVVWDNKSAYDLISTIDPDYRNSGASSLLIYEIINFLRDKVRKFDFEGSMIESVENSFRKFGAIQKAYFNINKSFSFTFKLINSIKYFIES